MMRDFLGLPGGGGVLTPKVLSLSLNSSSFFSFSGLTDSAEGNPPPCMGGKEVGLAFEDVGNLVSSFGLEEAACAILLISPIACIGLPEEFLVSAKGDEKSLFFAGDWACLFKSSRVEGGPTWEFCFRSEDSLGI
jgi:hypothetical protein